MTHIFITDPDTQHYTGREQVVSVAATNGSVSGSFSLKYGDQATAPVDANASAEAIEVGRDCLVP